MTSSAVWDARLQRARVPAGGLLAIAVLVLARPTFWSLLIGGCLTALGEMLRMWASGFIRKNSALATGGPYRFTRNPLYLGNLLAGTGVIIAAARWWLAPFYIAYFALIYRATIRREAQALSELFPGTYAGYCAAVPPLFPRLRRSRPVGGAAPAKFDSRLVWRNREYRAIVALLVIYTLLVLESLGWAALRTRL